MTTTSLGRMTELTQKIESRQARLGVVGLGYVGLPLTLLFSESRFRVTGFDIDESKVTALNQGRSYIARIPGTEIQIAREQGFAATSDFSQVAAMDVVIICVPTP